MKMKALEHRVVFQVFFGGSINRSPLTTPGVFSCQKKNVKQNRDWDEHVYQVSSLSFRSYSSVVERHRSNESNPVPIWVHALDDESGLNQQPCLTKKNEI